MFHLDNTSAVPEMPEPKEPQSNTPRWFGESQQQGGISWPGADWFNIIQAELLAILELDSVTPDKAKFDQVAKTIHSLSQKFPKELGEIDGFKQIGRCPDIPTLRATEPSQTLQLINVAEYTSGWWSGGGYYAFDAMDKSSVDNGGSVVVTPGGARWKALKTGFLPEDFGAIGGDESADTDAIQRIFNAKVNIAPVIGDYALKNFNRPSNGFEYWMTFNHVLRIDGHHGYTDLSKSTITLPDGVARITAIVITNSSGTIILPKIIGNMQYTVMPLDYIDDCAVRIGAGCKHLTVVCSGIDHYPGHGIVVRHYLQDGISSLNEGVPYNITIVANEIRHCWQSGIVLITGNTIRVRDFDVQYSGSSENANGRVATIGHNIHCESVSGAGGLNNLLRNVTINDGNAFHARMHGLMAHTTIDNLRVFNNNFEYNLLDGARYEGATHSLRSEGNRYSHNGLRGVTFNNGSLTAAGFPEKQHDAWFSDTCEFNGDDGFTDLSGSKGLTISGTFGMNTGHGITVQPMGKQTIDNVVIYNNGRHSPVRKYGINGGDTLITNAKIYNSDPTIFTQRPFNLRNRCKMVAVETDGSTYDFDVDNFHPGYFPENDGTLRLVSDLGRVIGRRMYVNNKGAGAWIMPDTYDAISIGFTADADMVFPKPSVRNLLTTFTLTITAGRAYVKVQDGAGTVNGTTQVQVNAGTTYRLLYDSETNLKVTAI
ncbi:right-handed parallel beta-helix repeat-containing protein [Serratia fonticola]|uniref:right-handed parallel beta-helix repeat-containing protein n=1 Tax=Serratia fonticola TaxID=47917 RepID=UPI001FD83AB8|nr:right-handed parallel beta-helix repeat-containing protein [Serratia fonticola]